MSENNAAGLMALISEALAAIEEIWHSNSTTPAAKAYGEVVPKLRAALAPAEPTVAPDAVRKLGARLAELLDEDQWAECEQLLLRIAAGPRSLISKWRHAAEHLGFEGLASLADCADELEAVLGPTLPTAPHAQPPIAGEPVALPFAILSDEMAALRRFDECVRDGQGYDVPDAMMDTLSEIGLLRRVRAKVYAHTDFGLSILNGDFDADTPAPQPAQTAPEAQPAVTQAEAAVERSAVHVANVTSTGPSANLPVMTWLSAGVSLRTRIGAKLFASSDDVEPLCPACDGSGEGKAMSGGGPDAYEVTISCGTCGGIGVLPAVNSARASLDGVQP